MEDIIHKLQQVGSPSGILLGDDVRSRKASYFTEEPCQALAIVRPKNTKEVSKVLRICHDAGQPVVPLGGNTGLVGGGLAGKKEIILSLERMNAVEELDKDNGSMTVQAGVLLQSIQEKAHSAGLIFALDLTVRGTATIGGNIAANAGGNQVIRYGMAREQILGLEAVLADGTIISSLNKMIKNNSGYDIKHLFIGSEGTLGVVTRAVLRLRPQMQSRNTALVAVKDFGRSVRLLRHLGRSLGGDLSAFEVMWNSFFRIATPAPGKTRAPMNPGYPLYVLVEATGSNQKTDAVRFQDALAECMENQLIEDAVVAKSKAQRDEIWDIRENTEIVRKLGPTIGFDISLRIGDMEGYLEETLRKLKARWPGVQVFNMGHLGDGNIHLIISIGSADPDDRHKVEEIVYSGLKHLGGAISAEHGVGLDKRDYLSYSRSETEIALMLTLKQALDPKGILNPGKVI